jgi:NADPH:quinone reductase-like Zn-dependent oxidoreductase
MDAFAIQKYGKNSPLERIEVPKPEVRDNDVLVEV